MEKKEENFLKRLNNVQMELKAPKGQTNKFGGYKYRSCEDILEAVKPLLQKNELTLLLNDRIENIGNRFYVQATATIYDNLSDKTISTTAYARESDEKRGMDSSQITGASSSYARKYALNGLFNIDDTKDSDTNEYQNQSNKAPTSQKAKVVKVNNETIPTEKISKVQLSLLNKSIENAKFSDEEVLKIIQKYGYTSTAEIQNKDYKSIINEFANLVKSKISKEGGKNE